MDKTASVLITLVVYNALLIGVGLWAKNRNRDVQDYFLAGRGLGPWVAAISASASSSSAWTLLGVSGAAYAWGLPALWIFPATVGGFLINWAWVAPRLKKLAAKERAVTLSEVIAPVTIGERRKLILRIAALIIVFCFTFYVASQFEAAGKAFESVFGMSKQNSIVIGAAIVLVYTILGGFWAVSVTDSIQGLLMAVASLVLPIAALSAVGGIGGLSEGLRQVGNEGSPIVAGGLVSLFFVLGLMGIGLQYPGQPHVVNRFMALKDDGALRQGRIIAMTWAVLVYSGMLLLGLCARVLFADLDDSEQVLFKVAGDLLPAVIAGVMVAAVLSAIMSTADSQLLVAASAISYDWNLASRDRQTSLMGIRTTVVAVLIMATVLALVWRSDIWSRVVFAWSAAGSAFGPILIMRLLGRSVSSVATLAAMICGFGLTVLISFFPNAPGDAAERLIPLFIALCIAAAGSRKTTA
jgi:sodium/proline symporter